MLVGAKRIWCCEPPCEVHTQTETCDEIEPRAVLSEQARAEMPAGSGPGPRVGGCGCATVWGVLACSGSRS